ncbi:MAG TPA: ABC transporter substrate-binding protein [Bradyrhizobium sp.]|jgi:putative ABC transport system substrate-binding protein|uniref:ABC transporter substrate-binding protein n=1 Tax=Bradyrhizobium sp. TaxID=376 RepID=UPI002CD33F8D|nr:ABC transporter substrate-binding protein [Bradyrhizobium sp.]HXB78572.1 ABC transporter substrate-binding protein [Bradyrhizobium sp.]
MRRREFITFVGGTAAAWPFAAQALGKMRRIGVLMNLAADDPEGQSRLAGFLQGLQEAGWAVGRNVTIDVRWAAADAELMKRFAKELVALEPNLILTSSTPVTAAMLQATRTIPVIFVLVADPVGTGFVASLPRPGSNVTGFTPIVGSLGGKWVEFLKAIAPSVGKISMMFNPQTVTYVEGYLSSFKAAAASRGMEASVAPVTDMHEIELLVSASDPSSGLVVIPDAFAALHRADIVSLAVRYRVPAINWSRTFTEGGGLISYGPNLVEEYRRAATYADHILKGEKPSELPVQTPVKFELVINLKTAKALGLEVPPLLQQRADEVVE